MLNALEFVYMKEFLACWNNMELDDNDMRSLESLLLQDPSAGVVMQGTGGLRKLRVALPGRGKSGGARVCYVDFVEKETILFIAAYPKNEKENLSKAERNSIKKLVEKLKSTL